MTKPKPIAFKDTTLFQPIKLGEILLSHRIAFAPLTRLRNDPESFVPNVKLLKEHYSQRSQRPGTLVITESALIELSGAGWFAGAPGIWSKEQTEAWKDIVEAIHANGSYAVAQLSHLGRQAHPKEVKALGIPYVAPSPIYIKANPDYPNFKQDAIESENELRALTVDEIETVIDNFVIAAKNAIESAGYDGVQVHAANGYLGNQFLDPSANQRTDKYGGSIENRSRFVLEIVDRLAETFNGLSKVSVRISPFNTFGGLLGASQDPLLLAQYAHLVGELEKRRRDGKELQFLEVIEPLALEADDQDGDQSANLEFLKGSNNFVSTIWKGKLIKNGGFGNNQSTILEEIKDGRTLVSIGRNFTSNPDLVDRLDNGWELKKYDRSTFYTHDAKGYIDFDNYSSS